MRGYFPAWWAPMASRSSAKANRDYIFKSGDKWINKPRPLETWEYGVCPMSRQEAASRGGDATRLMYETVVNYAVSSDFQSIRQEYPDLLVRHSASLMTVRTMLQAMPESLPAGTVCGIWLTGLPGTGKSTSVRRMHGAELYTKNPNKWFDGYDPNIHKYMVIEDLQPDHFRAPYAMDYHLKIWADLSPFGAEVKRSSLTIRPLLVYVTSNYTIDECLDGICPIKAAALKRRFHTVLFQHPIPSKRKQWNFTFDETRMGFDMTTVQRIAPVIQWDAIADTEEMDAPPSPVHPVDTSIDRLLNDIDTVIRDNNTPAERRAIVIPETPPRVRRLASVAPNFAIPETPPSRPPTPTHSRMPQEPANFDPDIEFNVGWINVLEARKKTAVTLEQYLAAAASMDNSLNNDDDITNSFNDYDDE